MLGHFNRTIEEGMTPTGQLLEKLQRIAAYCEGGGRFPIVGELYSRFHAWKQELDAFEDISIALESPRQTEALMRVVERKLEEARLVGL